MFCVFSGSSLPEEARGLVCFLMRVGFVDAVFSAAVGHRGATSVKKILLAIEKERV